MTAEDLYRIYAAWSGQLHYYCVKELGRHVDVEFFPSDYFFQVYSGRGEDAQMTGWFGTTVPALTRPPDEKSAKVPVPRPEANPSQADLDEAFRALCLAAARVLEADLGKERLPGSNAPVAAPAAPKKHAFPTKRLRNKHESHNPKRRALGPGKKQD
jgi:hypothetical protein